MFFSSDFEFSSSPEYSFCVSLFIPKRVCTFFIIWKMEKKTVYSLFHHFCGAEETLTSRAKIYNAQPNLFTVTLRTMRECITTFRHNGTKVILPYLFRDVECFFFEFSFLNYPTWTKVFIGSKNLNIAIIIIICLKKKKKLSRQIDVCFLIKNSLLLSQRQFIPTSGCATFEIIFSPAFPVKIAVNQKKIFFLFSTF